MTLPLSFRALSLTALSLCLPFAAQAGQGDLAKDAQGNYLRLTLKDAKAYCAGQGARLPNLAELANALYPAQGLRATSAENVQKSNDGDDGTAAIDPSLLREIAQNKQDGFLCANMYNEVRDVTSCGFFYNPADYVAPTGNGLATEAAQTVPGIDNASRDGNFVWSSSTNENSTGEKRVLLVANGLPDAASVGLKGLVRCAK